MTLKLDMDQLKLDLWFRRPNKRPRIDDSDDPSIRTEPDVTNDLSGEGEATIEELLPEAMETATSQRAQPSHSENHVPVPVPVKAKSAETSTVPRAKAVDLLSMVPVIERCFEDTAELHSHYTCHQNGCNSVSDGDTLTKSIKTTKPKAKDFFRHSWLHEQKLSYDETTGIWWLTYMENMGMFCILCKKHNTSNMQNNSIEYNDKAAVRFKKSAVKDHAGTAKHKAAIEIELTSRLSVFEKQFQDIEKTNDATLYNAFLAAYWLAKEEVANHKLYKLIRLFEKAGVDHMKYFKYTSMGINQEIILILGEVVREQTRSDITGSGCNFYGILTDEVTDISVVQLLVTFIQYVKGTTVVTKFLSIEDLLKDSESANAETISKVLLGSLEKLAIPKDKLSSFVSDGASVMTGKENGVAARLRREVNPALVSIHCICHRLALACLDTCDDIKYINKVQDWLTSLWKMFENSPKKLKVFLKTQMKLKGIQLTETKRTLVEIRLKKACATRWLSFNNAVQAFHREYVAVLLTLSALAQKDPKSKGLLSEFRTGKFLGAIYILHAVLPHLATLSKTLQLGNIHFSSVTPALQRCLDEIMKIVPQDSESNPVQTMLKDLQPTGKLHLVSNQQAPATAENPQTVDDDDNDDDVVDTEREPDIQKLLHKLSGVSVSIHQATQTQNLLEKYTNALEQNLHRRFDSGLTILNAFSVFDPTLIPDRESATGPGPSKAFTDYGKTSIDTITSHFYKEDPLKTEQVKDEFSKFKYQLLKWKDEFCAVRSVTRTPTLQCLTRLVQMSGEYELLSSIAELAMSIPVSNAWPERGASAVKRIKTRLRSRLGVEMLDALMQLSINAPDFDQQDAEIIIYNAVKVFKSTKRRHIGKTGTGNSTTTCTSSSSDDTDVLHTIRVLELDKDEII